ncbi:MAG: hypothetical protein ACPLUI_08350, partial [Desulfofundulus sp.]
MKIKKYIVREMQEAMRLIKEDMGPDAVIIGSYRLPRRSIFDFFRPPQLEVTAALDELPAAPTTAELPPGRTPGAEPVSPRELVISGTFAPQTPPPGVRRTRREGLMLPGGSTFNKDVPEQIIPPVEKSAREPEQEKEENNPSSFNIILRQQEEIMMDGDVIEKWRRRLLDMEVLEGVVEDLLSGLAA